MGQALEQTRLSIDEFLAWDALQAVRSELVDGVVYAVAGAEDRHVTLALNLAMALRLHLKGSTCRTFISDMKLLVRPADSVFYPDVLVTCSPEDAASKLSKSEPKLLAEILSPSTAGYDRGKKFACYRQLPSLQEYALVDPDSRRTDVYRMGSDGLWVLHPFGAGDAVQLASVDLVIPAEELFAEID